MNSIVAIPQKYKQIEMLLLAALALAAAAQDDKPNNYVQITSTSDFSFFLPPAKNMIIGDHEKDAVAFAMRPNAVTPNALEAPAGFFTA